MDPYRMEKLNGRGTIRNASSRESSGSYSGPGPGTHVPKFEAMSGRRVCSVIITFS